MNFSYYFFKLITITHENVQPLQKQLSLNAFTLVLHTFYFIFISLADHIISVYHFFSSILYFKYKFQHKISNILLQKYIQMMKCTMPLFYGPLFLSYLMAFSILALVSTRDSHIKPKIFPCL